jgi:hypothetical protein
MTALPVSLIGWKAVTKNTLRGFASVRIGKALIIRDVPVHCSHGKRWASMPSKPLLDSAGAALRDDRGKIKYAPLIEWADREASDRFSEGVIEAVERENPGATQADAGALQ